jgi:hypothetical protein
MRLTLAILMVAVATTSAAQTTDRFPILKPDQLTIDQKKLVETLMAGPRGGDTGPEAVNHGANRSPVYKIRRSIGVLALPRRRNIVSAAPGPTGNRGNHICNGKAKYLQ